MTNTNTMNPITRSLVFVTEDMRDRHNIREFRDGSISYITFDLVEGKQADWSGDEDMVKMGRNQLNSSPFTQNFLSQF